MEIALNKESKRKTPSVLSFRDGTRIFGEDAQTIGLRFPASSYSYLTDLLGKTIDNPIVKLYQERFPYYDIIGDAKRNTVVFKNGDDLFTIEELIAQILDKAKEFAQDSTQQPITECVIVVPGFFGQAERMALISAAKLANLKVLQLINDYTAVALNYGIFRRKEINETAQYFVFYDMGAYKTSATVVSYQLVKDKQTRENLPVIQVLGVGYDRTLGGLEMQLRLRDHLGQEFNKMKKTPTDVFTNARAMAKLFKEAGRVKNILSANTEHYAQIEGLLDDKDFRLLVTREQFETLCDDLFNRVAYPLNKALSSAGLTLDVVTQVTLFGGSTRVPKVQEILKDIIKQELSKNLNADEAATMGAVYQAADLATGFKVKKFVVKDAALYPIQVVFDREGSGENENEVRTVRRTLFGLMNSYPQKKVITFNKNVDDFTFHVNYADLDHLQKHDVENLGSLNLTKVTLKEVSKILSANVVDNVESKGIKAHFILDDSGIFSLTNVELVLEKTITSTPVDDSDESPLSKLGSTISKLFSSDNSKTAEENKDEPSEQNDTKSTESEETAEAKSKESNETIPENAETNKTVTEKPKLVTLKEKIPNEQVILFTPSLESPEFEESLKKIDVLNEVDRQKARRETALNTLESFVIEAQGRMKEAEFSSCASKEEIAKVEKACGEVSEWLYDEGSDADAITYEKKFFELEKLTNDIYSRHWEHQERPEAVKALHQMINGSQQFFKTAKNLTKETNPEKDVFTTKDVENLEKIIKETIEWRDTEVKEQNKLPRNDPVRLTVKALTDKMALLDREVKYLVNKIKQFKPKPKPKKEKEAKENTTSTTEEEAEKKPEAEENAEEPTVETPTPQTPAPEENDIDEEEVKIDDAEPAVDDTLHTEL